MATKTEHKLTCCMITQQLDESYFHGWSDAELEAIRNANAGAIGHAILNRLFAKGYFAVEVHTIIHDADVAEVWDSIENRYVIEEKLRHFHSVVKFEKNAQTGVLASGTLHEIADAVGIEPQYVEKAAKGRYAYDNMLAYLIHIKYPEKHQYAPESVVTCGCIDTVNHVPFYREYMDYYSERKQEWEAGRAKRKAQQAKVDVDVLEEKILLGEVTKNQVLLTGSFYEIYARNKRRCEDAFDTYAQRKAALAIRSLEAGEFKVSVFFLTGRSGSGKSYATRKLAERLQAMAKERLNQDWQVCDACATNSFDKYSGEEILIMDDLRGAAMSASDWLKLMTEDSISQGSARYNNKTMCCRVVIINSEKDVLDFFYYVKGNGSGVDKSEAMDQFFRRILARVEVIRYGDERYYEIGRSIPTGEAYLVKTPEEPRKDYNGSYVSPSWIRLNFDFVPVPADEQDVDSFSMSLETALDRLADLVWQRNTLKLPESEAARRADEKTMETRKMVYDAGKLTDMILEQSPELLCDEQPPEPPASTHSVPRFNPNAPRQGQGIRYPLQ